MGDLKRAWASPVAFRLVPTSDSRSFEHFQEDETGLPLAPHPGAFAVERKHHVHEGVDLYCPEGSPVFAVEDGVVVARSLFTGPSVGLPWWLDTEVVLVEGESGVVAYGEIIPCVSLGCAVEAGQQLGSVARVLRADKGRPTAMLHLELHARGTRVCKDWALGAPRPDTLLDPTPRLLQCIEGSSKSPLSPGREYEGKF